MNSMTALRYPDRVMLPDGSAAILDWRQPQTLVLRLHYNGAYGLGERFNILNQKGQTVTAQVEEKFCFQGNKSYCPAPFFQTDTGLGLYVNSDRESRFVFGDGEITVTLPPDCEVVLFTGSPASILAEYLSLFGNPRLPPKWAFGLWISANRWNTQREVERQLEALEQHRFPATVLVVEAWSDEATFYIWNGADYTPKPNGKALAYNDFDFSHSSQWPNPKAMIDRLHRAGVRLVLWQIPVYKQQDEDDPICPQHELDKADAIARGLCVHNSNGSPYTIPQGNWFSGSMIPDFTSPDTVRAWFGKRRYLLEMGVDGFKTDGGEFIYQEDLHFADGSTGLEGKNRYCRDYTTAYSEFVGEKRVLFSRAGWSGQHRVPIHWAGDQQSQNCELKSQLCAGLSAAMTGIPFWSFDIGGFAGPLPSVDLYRRATMLGCFCPVMQWHSEPDGGQFRDLMAGQEGNNERSPWNMALFFNTPDFLEELRYWHNLRMNLLPYLYSEAIVCAEQCAPMMRPMAYCYPMDSRLRDAQEQYMLGGSLLVAPLLEEDQITRTLALPDGDWYSLFTGCCIAGGADYTTTQEERLPVFLKAGTALPLHLPQGGKLGDSVGNQVDEYLGLRLILSGESGSYRFRDDLGNDFVVAWQHGDWRLEGACTLKPEIELWL